jgi:hypothetical protein
MEPVEVTARFDLQGHVYPIKFGSPDRFYQVESTGRTWQDRDGYHVLVMAAGDRVFELIFFMEETRWYLRQVGPGRAAAA